MHSFTTSGKKVLVKKILEKYFGCAQTHFIENLKKRHKNYFKGIISNIGVLSIAIRLTFISNNNIMLLFHKIMRVFVDKNLVNNTILYKIIKFFVKG